MLDSGSDVSMLPVVFGDAGSATSNPNIPLFDAQGGVIPVQDCRRVDIELQASGGSNPILRESCHVGDVGQPLMSFGRMMLKQWSIHADPEGGHLLTHPSGVSVPIFLKGRSLVVKGRVRAIRSSAETLPATLGDELMNLPQGWSELSNGFPVFWGYSLEYAEPTLNFKETEWKRRTTLVFENDKWFLLEFCELISNDNFGGELLNPALDTQVVVILTKGHSTPEEMMFEIGDALTSEGIDQPSQSSRPKRAPESVRPEILPQVYVAEAPRDKDEPALPAPAAEQAVAIAVTVEDDSLVVNDVRLSENSPIAVLRAACKTCDISQSGGKRKLFRRLVAFHGKQQLVLAKEVANQVDAQHVRQPDAPILHSPPKSAAEIQKHLMTHIPYAPWCEACISRRGQWQGR